MKQQDPRRRTALHIAAQLPEDRDDALKVLDYAREIVEKFLSADQSVRLASVDGVASDNRSNASTLNVLVRPE
jgi:hypothetical protein